MMSRDFETGLQRVMVELFNTDDPVLLSAVKAALAEAEIPAIEFDGPIADMYGALFPRRLMVLDEDIARARMIVHSLCPECLATNAG
jgi:hypothetical protein